MKSIIFDGNQLIFDKNGLYIRYVIQMNRYLNDRTYTYGPLICILATKGVYFLDDFVVDGSDIYIGITSFNGIQGIHLTKTGGTYTVW